VNDTMRKLGNDIDALGAASALAGAVVGAAAGKLRAASKHPKEAVGDETEASGAAFSPAGTAEADAM